MARKAIDTIQNKVALEEAVKNPPAIMHSLVNNSDDTPEKRIDQIIDIRRFHNLTSLLRVTGLVIKFATGLKEAEHLWIKSVQASSFTKEVELLQREDHKLTPPTYVTQFGLYEEGVVRCKGRLNNSPLPEISRKPILLLTSHEFVELLIKQAHESVQHSGIRDTLTTLRERFWVVRGREAVKRFIRKCVPCCKYQGMPCSPLPPNDLPDKRVSEDPPFMRVGLDFIWPLFIEAKNSEVERNKSEQLPRRKASIQIIFINTPPPDERVELLKPIEDIKEMNDDSEDINTIGLLKRYCKCLPKLENLTLADWAVWYDNCSSTPYVKKTHEIDIDGRPLEKYIDDEQNDDDDELVKTINKKNEETDLLGNFASYEDICMVLSNVIKEQMKQNAVFNEDFNEIQQQINQIEDRYDHIAPCTQNIERQQQAEGDQDLHPYLCGNYNLSDNLGIPSVDNSEPLTMNELPDDEYRHMTFAQFLWLHSFGQWKIIQHLHHLQGNKPMAMILKVFSSMVTINEALEADEYRIVDVVGKVMNKKYQIQLVFKNNKQLRKVHRLIADQIASIKVTLWEDAIDAITSGKAYIFTNLKSIFRYSSNLWKKKIPYNLDGGKTGFDLRETKLPTYWRTPFSKICLGMKINHKIRFIVIKKQADSLHSLVADGKYRNTSLGRDVWKTLIGPQASLQFACNKKGFNAVSEVRFYSKARIGVIANHQDDCSTCNSRIVFGTEGHNTCGNEATYSPDNGEKHIRTMGYILVQ
ncbi:hypothetical protein AWC38_SpisGene9511 [Stylophora pistillata]|uniref:Integrase zinc-binding domain-containing protein n=1 Tax=Stylophora pistillata TaxID=50429 RepID=A0A2B4S9W1_STYPI|nr:hypothetical protein AWC38_SpisGene9511 [Stylophora pistillata]